MRTRLLLFAALLFLAAGSAQATNVTVGCPGSPPGSYTYTSIQAALNALDVVGPHTITVTGTCTETVSILSSDRVTIEAPPGQTATIVHPPISDPDVDPLFNVINIGFSRDIGLRRLIVRGGLHGIAMSHGSVVWIEDCTVEENLANGILAQYSSTLRLVTGTMRNNGQFGVAVMQGSQGTMQGRGPDVLHVHDNWQGIYCTEASACHLNGLITIENNQLAGLLATRTSAMRVNAGAGSITIRNHGGDGVLVNFNSWAIFGGGRGIYVEENQGHGFNVQQNSSFLVTNTTVRNNARSAFGLLAMGYVAYTTGNILSGNVGPAFTCDDTSLLSLYDQVEFMPQDLDCKNVSRENGPPRPGRFQ